MPDRDSDQILTRLMALHPKVIDLSLDRMKDILAKLGNPERRLPPVLHVAGTNGKGSLLAYMRTILQAAGYRVHVFTSPHLVRFAERIVLAGETISETELSDLLLHCETVNGNDPITYFEITTAAAFKAFADTDADILLLETGLGGRLDATNVVEKPLLTALTPISRDHEQFLGSDLVGIGLEKAGIMKRDVPVVIGPQDAAVLGALLDHAKTVQAQPIVYGQDWCVQNTTDSNWDYQGQNIVETFPLPALQGTHQVANAATAVACAEKLTDFNITADHIRKGLQTVSWPARMQPLTAGPLVKSLPAHVDLWLDGGHNEAAATQIAASFQDWDISDPKPTYLICGMLNTKDQISFFRKLQPVTEKGITVPIDGEAAATPADALAQMGCSAGIDMISAPSVEAAIELLLPQLAKRPCRLLIAGSLYLAGQILQENA